MYLYPIAIVSNRVCCCNPVNVNKYQICETDHLFLYNNPYLLPSNPGRFRVNTSRRLIFGCVSQDHTQRISEFVLANERNANLKSFLVWLWSQLWIYFVEKVKGTKEGNIPVLFTLGALCDLPFLQSLKHANICIYAFTYFFFPGPFPCLFKML